MAGPVEVDTAADGTLVIRPRGMLGADGTVALRRAVVRAIRHERPLRLVLDLADAPDPDSIDLGTLAAACGLGDDHRVAVFLDHASAGTAARLLAAGVPAHRLRHIGTPAG